MKIVLVLSVALVAVVSYARGLACGQGAMTPMEARLERASGNKNAKSTRIGNAQRASAKIQKSVPEATVATGDGKVSYRTVSKSCPCAKQTVTASGGAKVGIGKTKTAAASAAKASASGNKVTW